MTSALHPNRPIGAGAVPCVEEIEAWVDEVRPVLQALRSRGGAPSSGQQEWLAAQLRVAAEALDVLECDTFEAEAAGTPCDELRWVHTRVCAVLDGLGALSGTAAA